VSVKEIQQAITQLPPADVRELSQWFDEFQNQLWDKQIAQDAKAGKFDELIEEAKTEYAAGRYKSL